MSSEIKFGQQLSLMQAALLIAHSPENRYMLEGEPGIGKSSLITLIAEIIGKLRNVTYNTAYMDVPNMDLGDIAMPVINHEERTTGYYPNRRFKLHEGKPVVIMLDEFTKGVEAIKNMLHPLLEVSNPRLGDLPIPLESIIFMTGNLTSDMVGDSLKAHTLNRIIPIQVRKPDDVEWLGWAVNNNIEPVVMSWVDQYPHALASYTTGDQESNPYIYNPKKQQKAFVSPRSLERASNIIRQRHQLDSDTVICSLTGAIGESGSRDMQAYIDYEDQLPKWKDILDDPKKVLVPDSAGACAVMVFGAINKVTKNSISPFMKYLDRFEPEWQATFAINIAKNPVKQSIAFSSNAFADWVQKNEDLL